MKFQCRLIQIIIFVRFSVAQNQFTDDYLQQIEKLRKIINGPKSSLKTKKYKCIEVDEDSDAFLGQRDDFWSTKKARISHSRTVPHERPKLRQVSLTSYIQAPTTKSTFVEEPIEATIEAPPAVYATGFPRARGMPSRRTVQPKVKSRKTIRGVLASASTGKPPLILSPEHCAQVKYYANMYGVKDVLGWVKKNCAFAKMYLPDATCEEINILIASCGDKHDLQPKY